MFSNPIVLLLFLLFSCFGEQGAAKVTTNNEFQMKAVGETANICSFRDLSKYHYYRGKLKWQEVLENYSRLNLTKNKQLMDDNDRFAVSWSFGDESSGKSDYYLLQIKNLRESDSGAYHCEIELFDGARHELNVNLTVTRSGAPALLRNWLHWYVNVAVMVIIVGLMRSKN